MKVGIDTFSGIIPFFWNITTNNGNVHTCFRQQTLSCNKIWPQYQIINTTNCRDTQGHTVRDHIHTSCDQIISCNTRTEMLPLKFLANGLVFVCKVQLIHTSKYKSFPTPPNKLFPSWDTQSKTAKGNSQADFDVKRLTLTAWFQNGCITYTASGDVSLDEYCWRNALLAGQTSLGTMQSKKTLAINTLYFLNPSSWSADNRLRGIFNSSLNCRFFDCRESNVLRPFIVVSPILRAWPYVQAPRHRKS